MTEDDIGSTTRLVEEDEFSGLDRMPAVGRERFWLPAANRYPFKTLLQLKRMRFARPKRPKGSLEQRAAKLQRLKAFARGNSAGRGQWEAKSIDSPP